MILGHGGDPSQSHQPHQSHLSHAPVVVNTAVSSLLATIQSLNSAAAPPSSVSAVSPPPELGWLKALEVSPTSAPPAPSIHPERQRYASLSFLRGPELALGLHHDIYLISTRIGKLT